MIVCIYLYTKWLRLTFIGELLEKLTRVLTDEEKQILDQDWVGRDGSKRKVEVCRLRLQNFL